MVIFLPVAAVLDLITKTIRITMIRTIIITIIIIIMITIIHKVERMWGLKTTTVPVVMGALGTIKKDMENYTNKIPGNINIHELQKITLLSTAHLLRRVLSIK